MDSITSPTSSSPTPLAQPLPSGVLPVASPVLPLLSSPDNHQLDKLPDLPSARPAHLEPVIWVVVLFFVSCAGVLAICGWFHLGDAVQTAFVGANAMLHTTAAAGLKADDIGRKVVYGVAANKNGITSDQS